MGYFKEMDIERQNNEIERADRISAIKFVIWFVVLILLASWGDTISGVYPSI